MTATLLLAGVFLGVAALFSALGLGGGALYVPLLVAADLQRPAAIEQLLDRGGALGVRGIARLERREQRVPDEAAAGRAAGHGRVSLSGRASAASPACQGRVCGREQRRATA